MVVETIAPSTQHIILKIVGFLISYQYPSTNYLAEELVESLSLSSAGSVLEVTNASSGVLLLVACCCSIMEDLIEVKRLKTDDVETGGGVPCKKNYRIIMSTNARY